MLGKKTRTDMALFVDVWCLRNAGSRVDYAAMKETSVGDSLSDSCMIFSVSLTVVGTAFDVARDIIGSSMLNRPVHFMFERFHLAVKVNHRITSNGHRHV